LPDGSTTTALVPQVYLAPKTGDLAASGVLNGSLISAQSVRMALSGDVNNSGTIAGRKLVDIKARNIDNSGLIQGDVALLSASQDININGGQVRAHSGMTLAAGGDLNLSTTTHSAQTQTGANSFARQGVDRVAGLYVSGPAGVLLASAGGDIQLTAAQLSNAGTGLTQLDAGGSVQLATVQVGVSQDLNWNATNYLRQSSQAELGSSIQGAGAVDIRAGKDVNLRAAQVNAQGALTVGAGGNVLIESGEQTDTLAQGRQVTARGTLSKKTTTTRSSSEATTALASELGGQSVNIRSSGDTRIVGSNVVADQDLTIAAGRDLKIEAAQNTQSSSDFNETKKSGMFSSGGLGVSFGKQQLSTDTRSTQTTAAASTVGAIAGNVTLTAGQGYVQRGSEVSAPGGDISIQAKTVDIVEAREQGSQ
ncbi:MAG: hemagglutinin repeat-containing protein, partial [Rubrivivax sp.]